MGSVSKDPVSGYLIDKIDGAVMRSWVLENGGFPFEGVDADATDRQVGTAMGVRFQEMAKADDVHELVECDVCEGMAPESLEACPFCGSAGGPPNGLAHAAPETHDEPPPPAEAATPKKAKKGAKKTKDEPHAIGAIGAVVEESNMEATQMNGKAKANGKASGTTADLVRVKGKGEPLAAPGKGITVKTLDRLITEAKALQSSSMRDYVGFGAKIAEIHDKRVWQLRTNEAGKAQYASFDAFVHHEFGITPQYATLVMKHGKAFTEEERAQLGSSKMTLLLQAPPAEREKLKKEAKEKKLTKRQLAGRVKEARKKANYTGDTPQAQRAALSAKNKTPKATAVLLDGKKTIKLYQRPPSLRNIKLEDLKRAKQMGERPFGIIELANQGRLIVEVKKNAAGEFQLTYEFQRPE
jgi:hypothetical protein